MNRKQKINAAVWTILAAALFVVLFVSLINDTPDYIWEKRGALHCYYVCGFLAAMQASALFFPFWLIHDMLYNK